MVPFDFLINWIDHLTQAKANYSDDLDENKMSQMKSIVIR